MGAQDEPYVNKVKEWVQERDACDPKCPGWALFNEGEENEGIQRCDCCERFVDDDEALRHVAKMAMAAENL